MKLYLLLLVVMVTQTSLYYRLCIASEFLLIMWSCDWNNFHKFFVHN